MCRHNETGPWFLSDAPVHPPVSETHPYDNQDPSNMPADTGYGCQMVDGVVHVYTKKNNMDKCVFVAFATEVTSTPALCSLD